MNNKIVEIAAKVMRISAEKAVVNCKYVPEIDAYYFWDPKRGGIAVIVSETGEKLGAASSVSYERHISAFKEGKRN